MSESGRQDGALTHRQTTASQVRTQLLNFETSRTQTKFSNTKDWHLGNKTELISTAKGEWVFEFEFFEFLVLRTTHFDVLRIERKLLNLD